MTMPSSENEAGNGSGDPVPGADVMSDDAVSAGLGIPLDTGVGNTPESYTPMPNQQYADMQADFTAEADQG